MAQLVRARDTVALFRKSPARSYNLEVHGGLHLMGGADVSLAQGQVKPMSMEERVHLVEQRVSELHTQISAADKRIDAEVQRLTDGIRCLEQKVGRDEERTTAAIKTVETGYLDLTTFGLAWLFVALMLTTPTQEVYNVLSCFPGRSDAIPERDMAERGSAQLGVLRFRR